MRTIAYFHAPGLAEGRREGLAVTLGLVVHRPRSDRVDVAAILLALRMLEGVAVDLGGAREEQPRAVTRRELEQTLGAAPVHAERCDRVAAVGDRAGGTRQMKDPVDSRKRRQGLGYIMVDERKSLIAEQMRDIGHAAGDEVVDTRHRVAIVEQSFAQVRADETGAPGHQSSHVLPIFRSRRWTTDKVGTLSALRPLSRSVLISRRCSPEAARRAPRGVSQVRSALMGSSPRHCGRLPSHCTVTNTELQCTYIDNFGYDRLSGHNSVFILVIVYYSLCNN